MTPQLDEGTVARLREGGAIPDTLVLQVRACSLPSHPEILGGLVLFAQRTEQTLIGQVRRSASWRLLVVTSTPAAYQTACRASTAVYLARSASPVLSGQAPTGQQACMLMLE